MLRSPGGEAAGGRGDFGRWGRRVPGAACAGDAERRPGDHRSTRSTGRCRPVRSAEIAQESASETDASLVDGASRRALPGLGRLRRPGGSGACRSQGGPSRRCPERHHHWRAELANPQRAVRTGPRRSPRRAPRGRPGRAAPGDGREGRRSGPPVRVGRAVLPARPGDRGSPATTSRLSSTPMPSSSPKGPGTPRGGSTLASGWRRTCTTGR